MWACRKLILMAKRYQKILEKQNNSHPTLQAPNRYHWSSNKTRVSLDFRSLSMHLPSTNPQILLPKIVWWAAGRFYLEKSPSCPPDQFLHIFLIIFLLPMLEFPTVVSWQRKHWTLSFFKFIVINNKVWKLWLIIFKSTSVLNHKHFYCTRN